MTWEIFIGLLGVVLSMITVGSVIVKLNTAIVHLNDSVERLIHFMEMQEKKNAEISEKIIRLDSKVSGFFKYEKPIK